MFDRRAFLRVLGLGAVGLAVQELVPSVPELDLDRLLWVPGQKTIFLPSLDEFEYTFITPELITREALRVLENHLKTFTLINRKYDDHFKVGGCKIGDTLQIRTPTRFSSLESIGPAGRNS